jgi:hypothetical protein
MSTSIELRAKLHRLIDAIKSEELLARLQEFLSRSTGSEETGIWSRMSPEQQARVMNAYASSFDKAALKPTSAVLKRKPK